LRVNHPGLPAPAGLYHPANEHDACGVGFVANIKGKKSHTIIEQGLQILKNLTHRGAVGADPLAGDGAGILIQMPDKFFREEMAKQGLKLPPVGQYGVGMVFLPQEPASRFACEYEIERAIKDEGQILLGWRDVPRDNSGLGESVKKIEPVIQSELKRLALFHLDRSRHALSGRTQFDLRVGGRNVLVLIHPDASRQDFLHGGLKFFHLRRFQFQPGVGRQSERQL